MERKRELTQKDIFNLDIKFKSMVNSNCKKYIFPDMTIEDFDKLTMRIVNLGNNNSMIIDNFIAEYPHIINWKLLFEHIAGIYFTSTNRLLRYIDKYSELYWDDEVWKVVLTNFSRCCIFSYSFITKYEDKIDWNNTGLQHDIYDNKNLPKEMIIEYEKHIDGFFENYISKCIGTIIYNRSTNDIRDYIIAHKEDYLSWKKEN